MSHLTLVLTCWPTLLAVAASAGQESAANSDDKAISAAREQLAAFEQRIWSLKVELVRGKSAKMTLWEDRKKGRIDLDEVQKPVGADTEIRFRHVFDGTTTTVLKYPQADELHSARRFAGLRDELSQREWASFFLGLRMRGTNQGLADLFRDGTVSRLPRDKVDGVLCESFEIRMPVPDKEYSRLYRVVLDEAHMFLPVRLSQSFIEASGSETPDWKMAVREYFETTDAASGATLFFPKRVSFDQFYGERQASFEYEILFAAINLEVPDSQCRIDLAKLPPGTLVEDTSTDSRGKRYVVEDRRDIYSERVDRLNPRPTPTRTRPIVARWLRVDLVVLWVGIPVSVGLILAGLWLRARQTRDS